MLNRLCVGLLTLLLVTGCSSVPSFLLPSQKGVSATAVGTQIAKEATQQAVANQSNAEAGRDVVITETELEAIGETVNIDQSIPPWVLIALLLGWLAPSPSEMGRGLMSMLVSLRGRGSVKQESDRPTR